VRGAHRQGWVRSSLARLPSSMLSQCESSSPYAFSSGWRAFAAPRVQRRRTCRPPAREVPARLTERR
jgi:hypothetical protein